MDENDFGRYGNFFFVRVIPNVLDHSYVHDALWQRHLKDSLQLNILRTWNNTGVESVPRYLTYYCMLLFLSNKPSSQI